MNMPALELFSVPGMQEVTPGEDLGVSILTAATEAGIEPRPGDVLIVAQKVVSKAEGRLVDLAEVEPSTLAS